MTAAAVTVDGLTVRYGDVVGLADVHIRVDPGTVCALIGVNGSGKSTLLKSILGVVAQQAGSVRIHDAPAAAARAAGQIGYVPQDDALDRDFPIRVHEVVMAGRYRRMGPTRRPSAVDRDVVTAALASVDLLALADRRIGTLSGGQRRRALVARAIAQEASILLLDEPFAGVDAASTAIISSRIRDLAGHGVAVLVSTHDLAAVPALADVAVLLMNRVLLQGPPAQVLEPRALSTVFGIAGELRRDVPA